MADDVEKLLSALMAEVKLLRAENAAILQRLGEEADVRKRVGVRVGTQQGSRLMLLAVPDICFVGLDATTDYPLVYGADGQRYFNFDSLDALGTGFGDDPRMMRTHKSFLVNLNMVRTVDNDGGGRILTFFGWGDDVTARVSDDHRPEFELRLGLAHA